MGILELIVMWLAFTTSFGLGAYVAVRVTRHSVENYVKKLTPEDLQKLEGASYDSKVPIVDEALWASGLTESEIRGMEKAERSFYDEPDARPEY